MDTSKLKKFAQFARRNLIEQVQSKLKLVLADESAARREYPQAVKDLEQKLKQYSDKNEGEEQIIEQVAYTWFNRFCALRFMDVNQYNRIMVLSPISGQFQPEILAEAKAGHLDDAVFNDKAREKIQGLLSGSVPSRDGQAEAYRLMIVAVCNDYHRLMPFLFQRIEDYTELLMPDDLLSGNSILAYTREAMTPENCESVESIGWLYQFYISEKKDLVFEGLKKNKKITPENIPAATQLFTPHWIVRYLVENSLGRLWMLNNPNSKVIEQMEYYIKPVGEETDFLQIANPEELKVCDNACGSGHMLTYAYDLLYAIYIDANYDPIDIPELILSKNLYGIEIDERAAELAAFALSMKALKGNPKDEGNSRRRFFRNPIKPNICRLEKVKIDEDALEEYMDFIGRDLFTQDLRITLTEFEEADNFGSLIQPTLTNVAIILAIIEAKNQQVDLFLADTHKSVLKILKQADYLSQKYQILITNPPYLGGKGMNDRLTKWAKDNYPLSKSDLFAMFIERNLELVVTGGLSAMVTIQNWMFLPSYEELRYKLLNQKAIKDLIQIGYNSFPELNSKVVQACAFVIENTLNQKVGRYLNLNDVQQSANKEQTFLDKRNSGEIFLVSNEDFSKIPGSPIAYWVSDKLRNIFEVCDPLESVAPVRQGFQTGDNDRFLRYWHEVSLEKCGFGYDSLEEFHEDKKKFAPYNKGGDYRKWFGNNDYVVSFDKKSYEQLSKMGNNLPSRALYFKPSITWSALSSGSFGARDNGAGFTFSAKGACAFPVNSRSRNLALALLNSVVSSKILEFFSPTLDFNVGSIRKIPMPVSFDTEIEGIFESAVDTLVDIAKNDWDSSEISWEFNNTSLMKFKPSGLISESLASAYNFSLKTVEMVKDKEEEINGLLISSYCLEGELDPTVRYEDISLFCNPYYRYKNISNEDKKALYIQDTLKEFMSYAAGCMFGRYSIDKEGLILANQGDSLENYLSQNPLHSFMPDADNVIPIIDFELAKDKDEYWFEDDVSERFKAFLKVTFGEDNFAKNLAFIEEAIGKDIKKYFVKDFYADHVKRYKKRPIYWMFSSPKGSFNALIYMHRYQPDTASIVLNSYLREFRTKLEARKESYEQVEISVSASQKDKAQAIKTIAKINKVLEEVNDYEHDILYPLAGEKIEINLDDGVKHNYPLFGKALKKVTGLS